jgi:hypothetical protein
MQEKIGPLPDFFDPRDARARAPERGPDGLRTPRGSDARGEQRPVKSALDDFPAR